MEGGEDKRGGGGLTVLSHHAAHPRAEVVHLAHAPIDLPRVARTVRLPLPTVVAPLWPPVPLAHEHILGVEGLETGAVRVLVGHGVADLRLLVARVFVAPREDVGDGAATLGVATQDAGSAGGRVERDVAGFGLDNPEGADVAQDAEDEEDEEEGEEHGGEARFVSLAEEVVDCEGSS